MPPPPSPPAEIGMASASVDACYSMISEDADTNGGGVRAVRWR